MHVPVGPVAPRPEARQRRVHLVELREQLDPPIDRIPDDLALAGRHLNHAPATLCDRDGGMAELPAGTIFADHVIRGVAGAAGWASSTARSTSASSARSR